MKTVRKRGAPAAPAGLGERSRRVLEAVIHQHVLTAQPVGSQTIAREYRLGASSATIRNVMAELEQKGYLSHPHTSAGRLPTERGYRRFVDDLTDVQRLTSDERGLIDREYERRRRELDDILKGTSELLAALSHAAGIVLRPAAEASAFKHIELIRVDERKILAILVGAAGDVRTQAFDVEVDISAEDLFRVSRVLNDRLAGRTGGEIRSAVQGAAADDTELHTALERVASLAQLQLGAAEDPVVVEGTANVLDQPEFADVGRVKALFRVLEEKRDLSRAMTDAIHGGDAVQVRIGSENRLAGIRDCSLVTKTYRVGERTAGVIGILGPTRMEYEKMVAIVDYLSQVVSRALGPPVENRP